MNSTKKTKKIKEIKQTSQTERHLKDPLELIVERGLCQFRLDGHSIRKIYGLAELKQKKVSVLLRQWVLEGLEREEANEPAKPNWAREYDLRIQNAELLMLMTLSNAGFTGKPEDKTIRDQIRNHISQYYADPYDDSRFGEYSAPKSKHRKNTGLSAKKKHQGKSLPAKTKLSAPQLQIYRLLSKEPLHFDIIAGKTRQAAGELSANLTMLEIDGIVKRHAGDYYSKL